MGYRTKQSRLKIDELYKPKFRFRSIIMSRVVISLKQQTQKRFTYQSVKKNLNIIQ